MFGQRLRLVRKRAGLSMQALADRVTPSVSAQAISKYEADKMMPSSAVLVGLGKALGVSLDFLLGGQVEALKSVEWRKNSTASAQDRAMAEALVIEKLEDYLAIEDILDLHPADDPFAALRVDQIADEEAIDAKAREVRKKWELGIDPIPSMAALLEDKGLKVIEADLPERINGLACHVERADNPPTEVIVVSRHTNVERKRFNLAHEIAHRIITATANAALKEPTMDRFAGAFLIPRKHLEEESGRNRHGMIWIEIMRPSAPMASRPPRCSCVSDRWAFSPSLPSNTPSRPMREAGGAKSRSLSGQERASRLSINRSASSASSGARLARR